MKSKFILFNSYKKANHYVKWCNVTQDYYHRGYDWSESVTYIKDNMILRKISGDGCGCGCTNHLYNYIVVIGKIKDRRIDNLKKILE
jgi:hypothetical protein